MNLQSLDISAPSLAPAAEPASGAASPPPDGAFGQVMDELAGRLPPGQGLAADAKPGASGMPLAGDLQVPGQPDGPGGAFWMDPAAVPVITGAALGLAHAPDLTLQAVDLGPSLRIITPASPSPDGASLAAFAKAQGLDEATVQWLLGGEGGQAWSGSAAAGQSAAGQSAAGLAASGEGATLAGPAAFPAAGGGAAPWAGAAAPVLAALPAATPAWSAQSWLGRADTVPQPEAGDLAAMVATSRPGLGLGLRGVATAPATPASAAGPSAAAPVPEEVLDLSADLPDGLDGPDALQALKAWLLEDAEATSRAPGAPSAPAESLEPPAAETGRPASGASATPLPEPAARAQVVPAAAAAGAADRAAQAQAEQAQRSEQYQALSQRLGEALAQRLVAQAERGHWNVRFMLRPQSLGQVEVELRLRSGEMDAMFRTPHALTRDLITEGLPRLREVLTQLGMDVAQMQVSTGQGQKNGGNPTPRSARPATGAGGPAGVTEAAPAAVPTPRRAGAQGLDILV